MRCVLSELNIHTKNCNGNRELFLINTSHDSKSEGYSNIKSELRSFKSNENIHKKEGGSYYVVSANKASSVTL